MVAGREKEFGHWGKFADAERDIRAQDDRFGCARTLDIAASILARSQRFYLPNGRMVVENRLLDDPIRDLVKLPFDAIAILTECRPLEVEGDSTPAWNICIAFDPNGATSRSHNLCTPGKFPADSICMLSCSNRLGYWFMVPLISVVQRADCSDGYRVGVGDDRRGCAASWIDYFDKNEITIGDWFGYDMFVVVNLCALLNLNNVKTSMHRAPEPLNAKRKKAGKPPLVGYHVLDVDGEIWDGPYSAIGIGPGYRSHLRRGHIRRREGGVNLWVRATYVHGNVDGFVDKDYRVTSGKTLDAPRT